ncbi:hypothetical protein PV11_00011 [Exophiala sideris]|uniref:AMP-dependent synthetase/ligase domain-containing protein n=1 Tax=Exophiala sideris TaxID=1016849 RepID=A0A0D1W6C0_9EURO|nr:hypothetical protein PV11_00011 [Exophiala sideris]
MPLAMILPLRLGIPTYFLPRFRTADFTQAVGRFTITDVAIVPSIAPSVTLVPPSKRRLLRSLRHLISAAAPMSARVPNQLYDVLRPNAVISQCWATTERLDYVLLLAGEGRYWECRALIAECPVKVDRSSVFSLCSTEGGPGEGLIHSPTMFSGYLNNLDASKAAVGSEGVFRTSDLVHLRAEEQVEDFVKSLLISYKQLTGVVVFVTKISRSNTGKILRGVLAQAGIDTDVTKV